MASWKTAIELAHQSNLIANKLNSRDKQRFSVSRLTWCTKPARHMQVWSSSLHIFNTNGQRHYFFQIVNSLRPKKPLKCLKWLKVPEAINSKSNNSQTAFNFSQFSSTFAKMIWISLGFRRSFTNWICWLDSSSKHAWPTFLALLMLMVALLIPGTWYILDQWKIFFWLALHVLFHPEYGN